MDNSTTTNKPRNPTSIFQDKNFYVVNLVTLIGILGGILYNPSLPTIQEFFKVTADEVSWISTLYQLPSAVITPLFGILADVFGRKVVLIPSLVAFAVGGTFSGLTSNFSHHLGWRLLQGTGAASLEPLQLTILSDLYHGKKMATAMAFNAGLIGIASALFPLVGGILGDYNWRYTFLAALLALPVIFLSFVTLRLPRREKNTENFSLRDYIQSTKNSISNRHVVGLFFAMMSLFLMQTLCLTYIPFLGAQKFNTSDFINGVLLTSMALLMAVAASQLGLFVRHLSEIKLIKLAYLLFAVSLLLLPVIPNFWLLFIPMGLLGFAQGLAFPCTQALLAGLSMQESRGGFMALTTTIMSWGQTLGPLLGALAIKYYGINAVFYTSGVFSLISFGIFNYFLTTKVFNFTAKTVQLPNAVNREESMMTPSMGPSMTPSMAPSFVSETIHQQPAAQLLHLQTNRILELPEHFEVITIGKPNEGKIPEVNIAGLPDSGVASRLHAQIRFDGTEYFIQDLGSSNGTYINKYPVLPGVWYKLRPGLRISLGRRDMMTFVFQLA